MDRVRQYHQETQVIKKGDKGLRRYEQTLLHGSVVCSIPAHVGYGKSTEEQKQVITAEYVLGKFASDASPSMIDQSLTLHKRTTPQESFYSQVSLVDQQRRVTCSLSCLPVAHAVRAVVRRRYHVRSDG